jgi:hypothetical protein
MHAEGETYKREEYLYMGTGLPHVYVPAEVISLSGTDAREAADAELGGLTSGSAIVVSRIQQKHCILVTLSHFDLIEPRENGNEKAGKNDV